MRAEGPESGDAAAPAPEQATQALLLDPDALTEAIQDTGSDPALLAGPDAIVSLGTRARAVAYTRPLHELEGNKIRLGGEAWAKLNLIELGFHAIDVVALRMDFDAGARHEDVVAALAALARQQDPDLEDTRRVGERVLEGLITGRGGADAAPHQASYGSWGSDGYVAKRFDYALLTEHVDAEGEFYLRATDPAISVLMGALDVDVESAQIASELRLNELVKRGLFTAAVQEAQRAKYRSIQYTNQLQRQVSQAQMHTAEQGSLAEADRLIEGALQHVIDRYGAERAIISNVAEARDRAEDPLVRRRANQLVSELQQCELRHQRLQRRLIRARAELRRAYSEQLAVGPTPPSRVELESQLLVPLLRAPLRSADKVARLTFRAGTAPRAPRLVDLEQLAAALCVLPTTAEDLGERLDGEEDDLVDAPDRRRFDDATWDAVDALLQGVEAPARLSELAAATDTAEEAHLLALRAAGAFDPAVGERLRQTDPAARQLLWWRPNGEGFETEVLVGQDLAVFPAEVVDTADAVEVAGAVDEP